MFITLVSFLRFASLRLRKEFGELRIFVLIKIIDRVFKVLPELTRTQLGECVQFESDYRRRGRMIHLVQRPTGKPAPIPFFCVSIFLLAFSIFFSFFFFSHS